MVYSDGRKNEVNTNNASPDDNKYCSTVPYK